jgi:hypothetical protein
LKREYLFGLRPGQRVECPRCGNMLEVDEDSAVFCDYCHRYWTLAELLAHLNGETRGLNPLSTCFLTDDLRISTRRARAPNPSPSPRQAWASNRR